MAINRGPFNTLVDDDGSNLVGSIWNKAAIQTVLLDPIDAMFATGNWTPADGSGAGLAFTVTAARYFRVDKLVVIQAHFAYPVTAQNSPAAIVGLPVACGPAAGGFYSTVLNTHTFLVTAGNTYFQPLNPASGVVRNNNELSGQTLFISGVYLTA